MIDLLAHLPTTVSLTGRTDEVPLASVTIPAGIMGLSGILRINHAYSHNLTAGNKTFRIYLGGTLIYSDVETNASATHSFTTRVRNRNSLVSQLVSTTGEFTPAAGSPNSSTAINTALEIPLLFTGQLAAGGDNLTLDDFAVEIMRLMGT